MDSEEKNNLTDEFVHEEGEVHLEGPMRFRDLYAFQLRYSYLGLSLNGIAYWIVTGLVAGLLIVYRNSYAVKTRVLMFLLLGILVIYVPGNTALRVLQYTTQLKANGIIMEYYINSTGILVIQKTENVTFPEAGENVPEQQEILRWNSIRKVKETRKRFFLYVMKNSAFVFGKDVLGEQADALRNYIETGRKQASPEV